MSTYVQAQWLYFWTACSDPPISLSSLLLVPCYLDHCSFVRNLEIRKQLSYFVLIWKNCSVVRSPLNFHRNLDQFVNYKKKTCQIFCFLLVLYWICRSIWERSTAQACWVLQWMNMINRSMYLSLISLSNALDFLIYRYFISLVRFLSEYFMFSYLCKCVLHFKMWLFLIDRWYVDFCVLILSCEHIEVINSSSFIF